MQKCKKSKRQKNRHKPNSQSSHIDAKKKSLQRIWFMTEDTMLLDFYYRWQINDNDIQCRVPKIKAFFFENQ